MRTFPKSGAWLCAGAALALAAAAWASPRKARTALLRGDVLRFNSVAITVGSLQDPRIIHTFTYSPAVRKKVEKMLETGGYQYGDRVKIRYRPGSSVALAISGKPSKPARRTRKRK